MLVLARSRGESIRIGDDVEVVVVSTYGGTVRLAIKAPKNIKVHRKEVYDRIKAEKGGEDASTSN